MSKFRFPLLLSKLLPKPLHCSQTTPPPPPTPSLIISLLNPTQSKSATWQSLTTSLPSTPLSPSIVHSVLQTLTPNHPTRALLFFHWSSHHLHHPHSPSSHSSLALSLLRHGSLSDAAAILHSFASKVFENFVSGSEIVRLFLNSDGERVSDPRVFEMLVVALAKKERFEVAVEVCFESAENGFVVSLATFNFLLGKIQKSDSKGLDLVWRVFELMVAKRRYPNPATVEIVVGALCKGGGLVEIVKVLDRICRKRSGPNEVVCVALVLRIVEEKRCEQAVVLVKRMCQRNLVSDYVSRSLIVHVYCGSGDLELARDALDEMLKRGNDPNSFVYTSLIGAYCREGKIADANHLMREMLELGLDANDGTYNFLIQGSSKVGGKEECLQWCTDMLSRDMLPSVVVCNEMFNKLCQEGGVVKANKVLTVMMDRGFIPDEGIYCKLVDGYARIQNAQEIMKLYYEMEGRGPSPGVDAYGAFISSLCKCGKFKEAVKVGKVMKKKGLVPNEDVELLLVNAQKVQM